MEKPNYTLETLKEEPHYSYSAFNTYLNICQLQYFYRYAEKREPERTPVALPFGSAFHSVLSEIASYAKKGELPKVETMKDAFVEYFKGFCNASVDVTYKKEETENDLFETAGRMIDVALREWPDFWNIESVALPFRVEVEGLSRPLIGELDMVLDNSTPFDDSPVPPLIVDFKTAARSWPEDKPDHDLQATMFTYAFEKRYGKRPEFRFDIVTKAKTPKVQRLMTDRSDESLMRMEKTLRMADKAISAGIFMPNDCSFACADCPYADACKSWQHDAKTVISVPKTMDQPSVKVA